jgi:6-pyruvoyltetrahydropterin/6-carboxytetrahydropterin synthase
VGTGLKAVALRLCRIYRFEAAHRLFSAKLSAEENERIFGKCARPGGHGHNYEVEICVGGELAADEARLIERAEMDRIVRRALLDRVDHRSLDDVLGHDLVSTGENLALTFFDWLEPMFVGRARLQRVRVRETRNNTFERIRQERP